MGYLDTNKMLTSLRNGDVSVGIQIRSRSPLIAEVLGYCGFDFLYIETEHYTHNNETIEHLISRAQLTGIAPIVRVPSQDGELIGHILDMGAMGVIIPHVDTAQQAKTIVEAAKFAPIGNRGSSYGCRASMFGGYSHEEYCELSNKNTAIIAMIESLNAVNHIDEILNTGIDLIRIGRNDLSESMGFHGKKDAPAYQEAVDHIIHAANERGIPVGAAAGSVQEYLSLVKQGFTHINFMSDLGYLKSKLPGELACLKEEISKIKHA